MNKIKMLFAAVAAISIGASVHASSPNALRIQFSSTNDKYADGADVIDGEWYALCWSSDDKGGDFKIVRAHPIAKDGGCPLIVFIVEPTAEEANGYYSVCLLDTRTGKETVAAAGSDGLPAKVNSWSKGTSASAKALATLSGESSQTVEATSADVAAAASVKPARISGYTQSGDIALITVSDVNPLISYNIKYGSTIDNIANVDAKLKQAGTYDGTIFFSVDKADAKFFQLVPANN